MKLRIVTLGALLTFGGLYGQGNQTTLPTSEKGQNATTTTEKTQNSNEPSNGMITINNYGDSYNLEDKPKNIEKNAKDKGVDWATGTQAVCAIGLLIVAGFQAWIICNQTKIFNRQAKIFTQQVDTARAQHDEAVRQGCTMGNQLRAAESAIVASQKSADATIAEMKTTIRVMRETAIKQLRGYITVQLSITKWNEQLPTRINIMEGGVFNLNLKVKNCGQTPTYQVRYDGGKLGIFDFPLPPEWNEIKPIDHEIQGSYAVYGAQDALDWHVGTGLFEPTSADKAFLAEGTTKRRELYAYGRIEYRDIYGVPRFTNFCYVMLPRGGDGALAPCIANKGNETDIQEQKNPED